MRSALMSLIGVVLLPMNHAVAATALPLRTVSAAEYVVVARNELLSRPHSDDGRLVLQVVGHYRDIAVSATSIALRAQSLPQRASSLTSIWVDIVADGRIARRLAVSFRVQRFKPAFVALAAINARQPITPELLVRQEVDVAAVRGEPVESLQQIADTRARYTIGVGRVLDLAALEARPPVEMGEQIAVTSQVGNVIVQTDAIAESDGTVGQRIRVRRLGSNETLRVRVMSNNTAAVSNDG